MPDYAIFGGTVRSDLVLPELREVSGQAPDWIVHRTSAPAPTLRGAARLGEDRLDGIIGVRALRHDSGYRIEYDDTGVFDIDRSGRDLRWHSPPDADEDSARADVMGRVMALALHAAGRLCLHGSAVTLPGGEAIALLAPKHHGKSTLAIALALHGGRLLTDDTLPVAAGSRAMAWPGVHRVRLWEDAARHVGRGETAGARGFDAKFVIDSLRDDQLAFDAAPLAAVYVIMPPRERRAPPVSRALLPPVAAALSIVQHGKLGPLIGTAESATLLDRAIALSGSVPVYSLDVVRDFEQLDAAVSQIMAWHASPHGAPRVAAIGAR